MKGTLILTNPANSVKLKSGTKVIVASKDDNASAELAEVTRNWFIKKGYVGIFRKNDGAYYEVPRSSIFILAVEAYGFIIPIRSSQWYYILYNGLLGQEIECKQWDYVNIQASISEQWSKLAETPFDKPLTVKIPVINQTT